jgi:AraC family transcriptional regulator
MTIAITATERYQQSLPIRGFGRIRNSPESLSSGHAYKEMVGKSDGVAPFTIRQPQRWRKHTGDVRAAVVGRRAVSDVALLYPEAVMASSDTFGWQNIRVLHLRQNLEELVLPPSDSHCLLLNLSSSVFVQAQFGKRKFEGEVRSGAVAILPAGSSSICRSQSPCSSTIMLLYLRPLFVRSAVAGFDFSYSELALTPQIGFRNKHIRHVAKSLLQELNEANVEGRLYADSLATGLAIQLVRRYSTLQDVQVGHGGMAPHKLRKAVGLIDRHLAEEQEGRIELRAVAEEVGMSYFHFSRAFKQSMGMSPTSYITERRIERAKELMNDTELPISEIALRSGFASQSHFTTSFRKVAGSTPRNFRAAI